MTPPIATSDTIESTYDLGITYEARDSTWSDSANVSLPEPPYNIDSQQDPTTAKTYFSVDLPPMAKALDHLNIISQMPDNWDSYGSPSLSKDLYSNAKAFICLLQDLFVFETPDVIPVSGGGVQFEWQYQGRELEIEFSKPSEIAFLQVFENESMKEGVFSIDRMDIEIRNFILWLFSNN
jgi:hypothetical protein